MESLRWCRFEFGGLGGDGKSRMLNIWRSVVIEKRLRVRRDIVVDRFQLADERLMVRLLSVTQVLGAR